MITVWQVAQSALVVTWVECVGVYPTMFCIGIGKGSA